MEVDEVRESDREKEEDVESDASDVEHLDSAEIERRRDHSLRRVVLAEAQFNRLKAMLKEEKVKQLDKRKTDLLERRAADYLAKKQNIENDLADRRQLNEVRRTLAIDSLNRKHQGNIYCAETSQDDNRVLMRERLLASIEERREKARMRELDSQVSLLHLTQKQDELSSAVVDYEEMERQRRTLPFPVIFHRLKDSQIAEDLRVIQFGNLQSEVRDAEMNSQRA